MPRQFNGQVHIRIPPELHKILAESAFHSGKSMSEVCIDALKIMFAQKANSKNADSTKANKNVRNG